MKGLLVSGVALAYKNLYTCTYLYVNVCMYVYVAGMQ